MGVSIFGALSIFKLFFGRSDFFLTEKNIFSILNFQNHHIFLENCQNLCKMHGKPDVEEAHVLSETIFFGQESFGNGGFNLECGFH